MAPALHKENITVNCLCPGLIDTALTEKVLSDIPPQYVTPMSTVLQAYDRFIEGDETGCTAEISTDKIYLREAPVYADETQQWVAENLGKVHNKVHRLTRQHDQV
jgi:NAD(P)-dependent dehydrogenase (short-subunit alcohol dehydrogenase family)